MSNRRTTLGPISQSTLNSRAGQAMSRPSLGPSRLSSVGEGFPLKLPRQSLAGPPAASRVSFGGNMAGNMMARKPIAAASRLEHRHNACTQITRILAKNAPI